MQQKTISALLWIVTIFDKHNIPYRVGGGLAAHLYGSERPINDIDISLSGTYFPTILVEVGDYLISGPKHSSNEKWDCDTLSLNYHGQEIDISDIDTLRMSNKERTEWLVTKDHFRKFPTVPIEVEGKIVQIIDPRDLMAYKEHLTDREYQISDIEAVRKYVATH
jgi:hypothetical protein